MFSKYETQGNASYSGMMDTNADKWLNAEFLQKRYNEYNRRFFENRLPNGLPVLVYEYPQNKTSLGSTWVEFLDTERDQYLGTDEIESCEDSSVKVYVHMITLRKTSWATRYQLENALLHEMCHVYQIYSILHNSLKPYISESKQFQGHGKSFAEAAMKVNLSKENNDNEQFFVSSNAFRNDALRSGEQFHHTLDRVRYCLERHLRISTQMRDTLASYGCYVENHQVKYSHKLVHEFRM